MGGTEAEAGAPHFRQNLAPGVITVPQRLQGASALTTGWGGSLTEAPHPAQNCISGVRALEHLRQCFAGTGSSFRTGFPQRWQNCTPPGSGAWHLVHVIPAGTAGALALSIYGGMPTGFKSSLTRFNAISDVTEPRYAELPFSPPMSMNHRNLPLRAKKAR